MTYKLGGVSVSDAVFEKLDKKSGKYTVAVFDFEEDDKSCRLYLTKLVFTKGDRITGSKRSEYALIAEFDKSSKTVSGSETICKLLEEKGNELFPEFDYFYVTGESIADFSRRVLEEKHPELCLVLGDCLSWSQVTDFNYYWDYLNIIYNLCNMMEPNKVISQMYRGKLNVREASKMKSAIGVPPDVIKWLSDNDVSSCLINLQSINATTDEFRLICRWLEACNALFRKRRCPIEHFSFYSFISLLCRNSEFCSVSKQIDYITKEMLCYSYMHKFDVISSMNYLKDTLEMIHKNGMKVQLQQNIRRWHHITSQNSRIFKNPRQEEFSKAVAKINAMGRHVFDSYEIKCPEDEKYFYVLGEAYNNCLARYRDEIIDRNGIVYCIYNRNTPDAIPEVTFEVNKDFDFIQIKTFNDEDVTDPDIIKMLKEWQKIARKGLCNG